MAVSSSSSSSSSSSAYCFYPECESPGCQHFSNWYLENVTDVDTTGDKLYVVFDNFGTTQQIEIYADPEFTRILAIGQGTTGNIQLESAFGSIVNGSVFWDGVAVHPDQPGILHCYDVSSSSDISSVSSSSSIDSSSSSSFSSSSESSTSSACCVNFLCDGLPCSHFSNWTLHNVNDDNSDNCSLYLRFYIFGSTQQVLIYRDRAYAYMVAIGQRTGFGTIPIESRGLSGITGSVDWDGVFVDETQNAIISCYVFSTSSSSSSSWQYSSSSTSSSSTESSSTSTSSSEGYSSFSSSSTTSSYSTSSESSESIGNVSSSSSSSSSSSARQWNETKPLVLGWSALDGGAVHNRIAQSLYVDDDIFSVGKVYIYLYGPYGDISLDTLHMAIYDCNNDSSPKSLLYEVSWSASTVTSSGWYPFVFNKDILKPESKYLSFVFWQSGSDENSYVLWGYEADADDQNPVWLSNNDVTWIKSDKASMAIKVAGDFNPYDLDNFRLLTPPASYKCSTPSVDSDFPEYDGTKLVASHGYAYGRSKVVLDYPSLMASFVVDSSGSMGWADRWVSRKQFLEGMVDRLTQFYPGELLIDMVGFGGIILSLSNLYDLLGTVATIDLDMRAPTRTTYLFGVIGVDASAGSVYVHNGKRYTVLFDCDNVTTLACLGEPTPQVRGELFLEYGTGDPIIEFNQFTEIDIEDDICAYGFLGASKSTYNIAALKYDEEIFHSGTYDSTVYTASNPFWNLFDISGESPSIGLGNNGPKGGGSVDFGATSTASIRSKFRMSSANKTARITHSVSQGDTIIRVDNPNYFYVDEIVEMVDGLVSSMNHRVVNVDEVNNSITITPAARTGIKAYNIHGGVVQVSAHLRTINLSQETTWRFELRCPDGGGNAPLTFFVETPNSYRIEWDFTVPTQWIILFLFWLAESTNFTIKLFDDVGDPIDDGTRVDFYVDQLPEDLTYVLVESQRLAQDALRGDTLLYLESITNYERGMLVEIESLTANQVGSIIEVDSDAVTVKLVDPLLYDFKVSDNASITPIADDEDQGQIELTSHVHLVDVTPMYEGRELDGSLLQPYDIDRVLPSMTYPDLYVSPIYAKVGSCDMPTIDGNALAHLMPITDDRYLTIEEKDNEASRILAYEPPPNYISQLTMSDEDANNAASFYVTTTDTTTTVPGDDIDYIIKSPIFTLAGYATTSMTSYSTELKPKFFPWKMLGGSELGVELFVKSYDIFPVLTLMGFTGKVLARQVLPSFAPDFASPFVITSEYQGPQVHYTLPNFDDCGFLTSYGSFPLNGVYAYTDEDFVLRYTITNKGVLVQDGNMTVRVYTNRVRDLDEEAYFLSEMSLTEEDKSDDPQHWQYLDISNSPKLRTLDDGTTEVYTPLTEWQQWREDVAANSKRFIDEDGNLLDEPLYTWNNSVSTVITDTSTDGASVSTASTDLMGDPNEWTFAAQYGYVEEVIVPVVNGHAEIAIPRSDIVGLIMVQASIQFGDNDRMEVTCNDVLFSSHPINISGYNDNVRVTVEDVTSIYDLQASLTWAEDRVTSIEDNTQVVIEPSETFLEPSISLTSGGIISGVRIGPHDFIPRVACTGFGWVYKMDEETVIQIYHSSGLVRTLKRIIGWNGVPEDQEVVDKFFHVDDGGTRSLSTPNNVIWGDGTESSGGVTSYLYDGINEGQYYLGGVDPLKRLEGLDQSGSLARVVRVASFSDYEVGGQEIINIEPSNEILWENARAGFSFTSNYNFGRARGKAPWALSPEPTSSYVDENGKLVRIVGVVGFKQEPGEPPPGEPIYPVINFRDPLAVSVSVEINGVAYSENTDGITVITNEEFYRDGIQSPTIVVYSTWRDLPITNTFLKNEGQEDEVEIDYPLPDVYLRIGLLDHLNHIAISEERSCGIIDDRGPSDAALTVKADDRLSLSSYMVTSKQVRTTVGSGLTGGAHRHTCSIDVNGNGSTTGIIGDGAAFNGNDHIHVISNYEVLSNDSHTHELACAAVTQMSPVLAPNIEIWVQAFVEYDPTNCIPYKMFYPCCPDENGKIWTPSDTWEYKNGNRMIFGAAKFVPTAAISRTPYLRIYAGQNLAQTKKLGVMIAEGKVQSSREIGMGRVTKVNNASYTMWASRDGTDYDVTSDLRIEAGWNAYTYEEPAGHFNYVPAESAPDGTRISLSVDMIGVPPPLDDQNPNTTSVYVVYFGANDHPYMTLRVRATVCLGGDFLVAEGGIKVLSTIPWLPSVKGLLPEPVNDQIYFDTAYPKVEEVGCSRLYDAIRYAGQRLIDYQYTHTEWMDAKKVVFVLSDGDENLSEFSLNQAASTVNFIQGDGEVPIVSINLGRSYPSDSLVLKQLSLLTQGSNYHTIDADANEILELQNRIISSGDMKVNIGVYGNMHTLIVDSLLGQTALRDYLISGSGNIQYRWRYSSDQWSWSSWSQWYGMSIEVNLPVSLDYVCRYVEYQIRMTGGGYFETPELYTGMAICYHKSQSLSTFFVPIDVDITDDEYVSSIHVTHTATLPDTSVVEYDFVHMDSTDVNDYYSVTRPMIKSDQYSILLSRYNEPLTTTNYYSRIYTAINGRWPFDAGIEVYRVNENNPNGVLVASSEYASNPSTGQITFNNLQSESDIFVICVDIDPEFRMLCRVTNYGPEAASIDHIGIMYNVAKRVPRNSDGTIIHTPFYSRFKI